MCGQALRRYGAGVARYGLMEVSPDTLGGFAGHDRGERVGRGLLYVAQAAEVRQQPLARERTHARDIEQFRAAVAHGTALAMVADGKSVALVADHLDQVKHWRAA